MNLRTLSITYGTITALGLGMLQPMTVMADPAASQPADEDSEIVLLYTNDVHSNIDKPLTYSTVAAYHKQLENSLLLDAGDEIQGSVYGAMDKGATVSKLMNAAHYDAATLGNHEFDYGMQGCFDTINRAEFPYLSCNFYHINDDGSTENVLDSYVIKEVGDKKIAIIGISTPQSLTSSTPTYFMDETKTRFLYGFNAGSDGADLYASVQKSIDAADQAGADYIVALGHLGVAPGAGSWTSENVIRHTRGLDAFIDGHSHTEMDRKDIEDLDGNTVVLTQTGSYFGKLGEMTIAADGLISTRLLSADDLADVEPDADVQKIEKDWINDVTERLGQKIASSKMDLTVDGADGNRRVRMGETNAANFVADAYYWFINEHEGLPADFVLMNAGGIRATIPAGDLTYNSLKTINPFGNQLCIVEVDGQTILDALEFGARFIEVGENGGLFQPAGLMYQVDTSIPNTVSVNENKMWTGAPKAYRVHDVQIYDKDQKAYLPLDLKKQYRVAGASYTLRNAGDGNAMFSSATLIKDNIVEDYLSLAEYAKAFKDLDGDGYPDIASEASPLASYEGYGLDYEKPEGIGRLELAPLHETPEEPLPVSAVYRLYNSNSGEHFYTPSSTEQKHLVKVGWKAEPATWGQTKESTVPVYRVYNPNAGDHHYTTSKFERDSLVKLGWRNEAVGFYAATKKDVPVYRLYNPNAVAGAHHFTTSQGERAALIKIGWKDEGIAFYAEKAPAA